jgi:hypothetical protein
MADDPKRPDAMGALLGGLDAVQRVNSLMDTLKAAEALDREMQALRREEERRADERRREAIEARAHAQMMVVVTVFLLVCLGLSLL